MVLSLSAVIGSYSPASQLPLAGHPATPPVAAVELNLAGREHTDFPAESQNF